MFSELDPRTKLRRTLFSIILITIPCYCIGLIALTLAPDNNATPTPTLTSVAPSQTQLVVTPLGVSGTPVLITASASPSSTITQTPTSTVTPLPSFTPFLPPTFTFTPSITFTVTPTSVPPTNTETPSQTPITPTITETSVPPSETVTPSETPISPTP